MFFFFFVRFLVKLKRRTVIWRSTWEGEEMMREEVTERGTKGEKERVTIPPDGAGFCSAFPPDYANDQFVAALEPLRKLLLSSSSSYAITALFCLIPRVFFLICFLFLSPASFLLSSRLLNDDICTSVSVCPLASCPFIYIKYTEWSRETVGSGGSGGGVAER